MNFASDNSGPAHPKVIEAIVRANDGYTMPYGNDPYSIEVNDKIRDLFDAPHAAVVLVGIGTAANALALSTICPPWGRIFCHELAHIEEDECGAPEAMIGGGRLTLLKGDHAKITPETLADAIAGSTAGIVHSHQPAAVCVSNLSELGAASTPAELQALAKVAHAAGLKLHLDGARFANACAATGATAAEMAAPVDTLAFGGTKNGLMGVEAVVIFDPDAQWELELRRKRAAQLFSKHRFLAAQMDAYMTDELWLEMAHAANAAATDLANGLRDAGVEIAHPVDGNQIFARPTRAQHRRLQDAGAAYYLHGSLEGPDEERVTCRLVTNWSTSQQDRQQFLAAL